MQKKSANATLPGRVRLAVFGGAMLAYSSLLFAQGLPDPTRPPPGFVDPAEAGAAAALPSGLPVLPAGSGEAEEMVLQSVMLPQRGKPVAIISGKYVPLGAQIDGWELKSVSEREVTVQQGGNRRLLRLTPLVSKSPVETGQAAQGGLAGPGTKPLRKNKAKQAVVKESESKQ